jgi:hypothetical protein
MRWHVIILLVTTSLFSGCSLGKGFVDSFKTQPGQRLPTLPVKEPVLMMNAWVSVQIQDGNNSPFCSLPDASNTTACYFTYGWLDAGGYGLDSRDGYRYLNLQTARDACSRAIWSTMGNSGEVEACSRALMVQRWMRDAEIYEEAE